MDNQFVHKDYIRLPKNVKPSKYTIDIYLDIYKLVYEIKEQISISFDDENTKYICLHALPEYQISSIKISTSYDLISEKYNFQTCTFVYSESIMGVVKMLRSKFKEIISKVKGQIEEYKKINSSNYKENQSFLNSFNQAWMNYYQNFADFITRFCIDNFFDQIEDAEMFSEINVLEETIYIILPINVSRFSQAVLKIEVIGPIRTRMEGNGFYFSFFGENAKLLYDQKEFLTKWRDPLEGKKFKVLRK